MPLFSYVEKNASFVVVWCAEQTIILLGAEEWDISAPEKTSSRVTNTHRAEGKFQQDSGSTTHLFLTLSIQTNVNNRTEIA